jgi:peptide-methionine (S)-S-oxide reductase
MNNPQPVKTEVAVLGGGCFWCLEGVFLHTKGVLAITSGYAGGEIPNPSYKQVCSGRTGHAEVVRVEFDPGVLPYEELLRIFFSLHDPTTLNRQGNDVGTQYRSIIVAQNNGQRTTAERVKQELNNLSVSPVVTEIVTGYPFYPADEYHQRYFEKHPEQAYCRLVVAPKVEKFRRKYGRYYRSTNVQKSEKGG